MRFSTLAGRNRHYFQSCVMISVPLGWSFSQSHVHVLISIQLKSQGGLCKSPEFFFCTAFSSPAPCPANSSCPGFPNSRFHSLIHLALPGFPLPVSLTGNSFQAVSWGNHRAHLVLFPLLRCPVFYSFFFFLDTQSSGPCCSILALYITFLQKLKILIPPQGTIDIYV